MKIMIADDHELFLKGLEFMLQSQFPDAQIITASNYTDLFDLLKNLHGFDLIITDLAMPGANSIEGIKRIYNLAKETPIIILSAVFDNDIISKTLDIGVGGYVLKASSNKDILAAINLVLAGGIYIPQDMIDKNDDLMMSIMDIQNNDEKPEFTARQIDVLQKIAEGKANKQIAFELNLTEGTVKYYVTAILKKLNVYNRTAAGLKAIKLGIYTPKK